MDTTIQIPIGPALASPDGKLTWYGEVLYRNDLYPRMVDNHDPALVQRYAEHLDVLPPIEVNERYELIDGKHRLLAHVTAGLAAIAATVTPTASDNELLELAIRRNANHGYQLTERDKQSLAVRLYDLPNAASASERAAKKRELATLLSVSRRAVENWVDRIDQTAAEARKEQAYDRWLACATQQEIADALGMAIGPVNEMVNNFGIGKLSNPEKNAANHGDGFDAPLYNVWSWGGKTNAVQHPGNSEQRIVDNLLYLYTEPHGTVIDPFAGGGSTIDVCRKRHRRYWVSDLTPVAARAGAVRQHDITAGMPRLGWKDVQLAYLDPPYWKQLAGKYSDSPQDLSNQDLDVFHVSLAGVIKGLAGKMPAGSHIALLMAPTRVAPDYQFCDHTAEMIRRIKLPVVERIQCPYSTQQYTGASVDAARDARRLLSLSRELTVWEVR